MAAASPTSCPLYASGVFPPDVTLAVVELLNHSITGGATLQYTQMYSLGLVSRFWLAATRPYCFQVMELSDDNAVSFVDLVASPHCTLSYCSTTLFIRDTGLKSTDWLTEALTLPNTAFSFVKELSFAVSGDWAPVSSTVMENLPLVFSGVVDLVPPTSINDEVTPENLVSFVSSFPALQRLQLYSYYQYGSDPSSVSDPAPFRHARNYQPPPYLRDIYYSSSSDPFVGEGILSWLSSSAQPSLLESFYVYSYGARCLPLENTLRVSAGSLLRVTMAVSQVILQALSSHVDWAAFAELQYLDLHFSPATPDDMQALIRILTSLRDLPHLHWLSLQDVGSDPARLDAVFNEPSFSVLEELTIITKPKDHESILPICRGRGFLSFRSTGYY
ncbi:hypothetical protein HGRIS_012046 [Hohenbuehelia grisea]|uniref:F-box protein n=1 Tax=Hohenbuehelia grisea TaxID=104357 RepID=A0ABR3IR50_9AGAR